MRDYVFLTVGVVGQTVDTIKQVIKYVEEKDKRDKVVEELDAVIGLTLVFVERKKDCNYLGRTLEHRGYSVASIHGDRTQNEREAALNNFRMGIVRTLVATSVAARGLDIPDVAHVINFDLPGNIDDYVHRIGRTGRCGKAGLATAFYNHDANFNIARDLAKKLQETHQEVPSFLYEAPVKFKKQKKTFGRPQNKGYMQRGMSLGYGKPPLPLHSKPLPYRGRKPESNYGPSYDIIGRKPESNYGPSYDIIGSHVPSVAHNGYSRSSRPDSGYNGNSHYNSYSGYPPPYRANTNNYSLPNFAEGSSYNYPAGYQYGQFVPNQHAPTNSYVYPPSNNPVGQY